MPKKPNSHGDLQNYVPPGNGDASGEYADGEGSNIHYFDPESFGKGKGETEPKKEEGHIEVSQGEPKGGNFSKYLETFKEAKGVTRDGLKGVYETGTEDARGVIDALIADGYKITPISGRDNFFGHEVNLTQGTVEHELSRNKGEVFYHEFHHAIDDWLAKDATDEEYEEALPSIIGKSKGANAMIDGAWAKSYGSAILKTSSGKTLFQTILGEIKGSELYYRILKDFHDDENAAWKKAIGMTHDEFLTKRDEADARLKAKALSEGLNEWTGPYWERIRELRDADEEYKKLEALDYKGRKAAIEAKKKWVGISDTIEGAGGVAFYGGHGASYWKSGTRRGTKLHRGAEFIAEYGSAYSRRNGNGKEELELFRKYFPESSKAAEELCERAIKKSKGAK